MLRVLPIEGWGSKRRKRDFLCQGIPTSRSRTPAINLCSVDVLYKQIAQKTHLNGWGFVLLVPVTPLYAIEI